MSYLTNKELTRLVLSLIGLLGLIIGGVYLFNISDQENKLLREKYEITKGVIIDARGYKRGKRIKYNYTVHGEVFNDGRSTHSFVKLGDTIDIIYYPSKPSINRLLRDFKFE